DGAGDKADDEKDNQVEDHCHVSASCFIVPRIEVWSGPEPSSIYHFEGGRTGQIGRILTAYRRSALLAGELRHLLFPMLAVEQRNARHAHGAVIEAAHIDAETVGLRARNIEALDAAHRAEMMLRRSGIERVGGDLVRALGQSEALGGHDEMQIAGPAADRAVAFLDLDLVWRQHFEAYRAAMA